MWRCRGGGNTWKMTTICIQVQTKPFVFFRQTANKVLVHKKPLDHWQKLVGNKTKTEFGNVNEAEDIGQICYRINHSFKTVPLDGGGGNILNPMFRNIECFTFRSIWCFFFDLQFTFSFFTFFCSFPESFFEVPVNQNWSYRCRLSCWSNLPTIWVIYHEQPQLKMNFFERGKLESLIWRSHDSHNSLFSIVFPFLHFFRWNWQYFFELDSNLK